MNLQAKSRSLWNTKFYKKSYLLEFFIMNELDSAFTFAVPPQSEDLTFGQRINETKTFGGSVIDDYGNEMVKITLSGSTINNELKYIYRSSLPMRECSGETEIFYLQHMLRDYGKFEELTKGKKVFLYSLDRADLKSWQVFIQDFQIKRSKENPFAYNYTITMLGDPAGIPTKTFFPPNKRGIENVKDYLLQMREKLLNYLAYLQPISNFYAEVNEYFSVIRDSLETIESMVDDVVNAVNGIITGAANVIDETIGLGDTYFSVQKRFALQIHSIFNASKKLLSSCKDFQNWVDNFLQNQKDVAEDIKAIWQADIEEIKDITKSFAAESTDLASELVTEVKENLCTTTYAVNPGSNKNDDSIVLITNVQQQIAKANDTWDNLANSIYGDSSYAPLLAFYNGGVNKESDISEIKAGQKIYIPVFNKTETKSSNNKVYNEPDVYDNYGHDIKIENGDFAVHLNDLDVTNGVDSLTSAIDSRLNTAMNSRVRNVAYGIRNIAGSTEETNGYLMLTIKQTIEADPRIQSVENLEWTGEGSSLNVNVTYTDINNQKNIYGGKV